MLIVQRMRARWTRAGMSAPERSPDAPLVPSARNLVRLLCRYAAAARGRTWLVTVGLRPTPQRPLRGRASAARESFSHDRTFDGRH